MPQSPTRQLVLVQDHRRQSFQDFLEIAKLVVRLAPDIAVHIFTPRDTSASVPGANWKLPTVSVSFGWPGHYIPLRGPLFTNRVIKKLEQHARFRACGIATPHTERFAFGKTYDESVFGKFAVLKVLPLKLTSDGQSVQLFRTARLATLHPSDLPEDHFMRTAPALIQQYIDTGNRPTYFRVLTVFGEPVMWMLVRSAFERGDLSGNDDDIENVIVDPRRKTSQQSSPFQDRLSYEVPDDVMRFGRDTYAAFPDVPLQACDILQEEGTGKLYAIEINAGGNTWDFSSRRVARGVAKLGGRDAQVRALDPWPRAAKAFIATVRKHAT